jgi:hypothetical protein
MAHTCASFDHEGARLIFDTEKKGYRIKDGLITHNLMSVDEYNDELETREIAGSEESVQELLSAKQVINTRQGEIVSVPFRDFFGSITNPAIHDFLRASRTLLVRNETRKRGSGRQESLLSDVGEITSKYNFVPCNDKNLFAALEEYLNEIREAKGRL